MSMNINVEVGNSLSNMANKFFRRVDSVVYDLQSGKTALKNGDGSLAILNVEKTDDDVVVGLENVPFNISMSLPAFAIRTDLDKVAVGDVIINENSVLGFVIEVEAEDKYKTIAPNGAISTFSVPANQLFGKKGVMVVQSFNFMGEGEGKGFGDMNPLMLMALMGGNSNIDPMMLMAMSGGLGDMNPLMLMALAGRGLDFSDNVNSADSGVWRT